MSGHCSLRENSEHFSKHQVYRGKKKEKENSAINQQH